MSSNCNKCNKSSYQCGCEKPVQLCGCSTKVDAKCVIYDACALTPLGVIRGDNLEEIIKMINDMFSDVYVQIDNAFIGMNTGLGAEVYKGQNSEGIEEFRTFDKGTGILINQKADSIEISADTEWFENMIKNFVLDEWFINYIQTLIKQQWFVDYLQTLLLQPWFGEIIKYWIKQDWFTTYLNQLLQQQWFINLLTQLLQQQWFVDYLQTLLLQPWFGEIIKYWIKQDWFTTYLNQLLQQQWFINLLTQLLQQQWFINLLQTIFNQPSFQQFFANYIKNIFTTGLIDICELIQGCTPQTNNPPVMNGDVTYNVANRVVNFPLNTNDFTSKYFDAEGDTFVSIKITGGDLTGLIKADLTPLAVNDIIPVNQISQIKFNGKNQDPGYTQTVTYVAINSAGQQSN